MMMSGGTRGMHGVLNNAGREFLVLMKLCALCNTWFSKCEIYKQIWRHPKLMVLYCLCYH